MFDKSVLGDCKETEYAKNPYGYGQTTWRYKTIQHHRLAWCLATFLHPDEIKGLVLRHICDNPSCVNVNHLELGTQANNMKDAQDRGRNARGSKSSSAILTETEVREIRARGREPQATLAAEYKVSQQTISVILTRKRWKHLEGGTK